MVISGRFIVHAPVAFRANNGGAAAAAATTGARDTGLGDRTMSAADRMLAEQLGREARENNELSDAAMAQRLQNEANNAGAGARGYRA